MTSGVLARLEAVSFAYDRAEVLSGITLEVSVRDFLGIVGPSGSGKTTLLRIIAGALEPLGGTVERTDGLRVGYVPQVETINWNFPVSVLDVVMMARGGRPLPWPSRDERRGAAGVLERLGIAELAGNHIRELSGGQQQRAFIGRALMGRPQILLLDEPTSGVDVATRHDVLHLLHDLNHDDGVAVVITTHDLNGIASHMHTLACLNRRLVAVGAPSEILTTSVLEQTYGAPMEVLSHGGMPVVVEARAYGPLLAEPHHGHD